MIEFVSPLTGEALTQHAGQLIDPTGNSFPIINGIPRFVPVENYASAFGYQWKKYAKTQLDTYTGNSISKDRLNVCLGYPVEKLAGKTVLEVGSGAGRFTEHLVKAGALTHCIDLSVAVEVNKENVGEAANYKIAQASVYELPYPKASFDVVVCIGVIQHTPSSEKTIQALYDMVKPGGQLIIDHYIWRLGYFLNPATYWRLYLKEIQPEKSKKIVDKLVNIFFPMHWALRNVSVANWFVKRVSPVMTYMEHFPELSHNEHYELAKLDSYDSLTDYYKHLRTPAQIKSQLEQLGAKDIYVTTGGNGVEARANKP
jgi:ubiquinone/menaquinone biosynthesis C-methylase UbiE